jgi:hypothetical protein
MRFWALFAGCRFAEEEKTKAAMPLHRRLHC